jgi:hypothetical protein
MVRRWHELGSIAIKACISTSLWKVATRYVQKPRNDSTRVRRTNPSQAGRWGGLRNCLGPKSAGSGTSTVFLSRTCTLTSSSGRPTIAIVWMKKRYGTCNPSTHSLSWSLRMGRNWQTSSSEGFPPIRSALAVRLHCTKSSGRRACIPCIPPGAIYFTVFSSRQGKLVCE